jgi:hypothetical protein
MYLQKIIIPYLTGMQNSQQAERNRASARKINVLSQHMKAITPVSRPGAFR